MQELARTALAHAIDGQNGPAFRVVEHIAAQYHSSGLMKMAVEWADQVVSQCNPHAAGAPLEALNVRAWSAATRDPVARADLDPSIAWAIDWICAAMARDLAVGLALWRQVRAEPAPLIKALLLTSSETIRGHREKALPGWEA